MGNQCYCAPVSQEAGNNNLYYFTDFQLTCPISFQGLICVGTEGGSLYVYGDGFQYMRPWLTDEPNEVVSIVALHPNRILVTFCDNSMVVMELPTLEIIDLLKPTWMHSKWGDITAVHCDAVSEKNFVYIGTSDGYLTVLDVMEGSIRICDFELNLTDMGLQGMSSFSVSDIQSCPKDERYLAIGFDGTTKSQGAVVVYDLVKHKVHKQFKTASISTLQWHHLGEILYAGTSTGEILVINPEKNICISAWNAKDEKIEDDEHGESSEGFIRRISWLPPQTDGTEGCLFVLVGKNPPH
jgi:WD40 repeat protein